MRKHKGFTLIELVVVVMILGILAAVAAPKLLGTSSSATDNGLKETLGVVRDAIERYTAEHGGTLPDGTSQLTFKAAITPYLRSFPKSPLGGADPDGVAINATAGSTTPSGTQGWMYNKVDGTFFPNSSAAVKSDTTGPLHYNEL